MLASSSARCVAASTAFMNAARTPAFSSSCTPAIVVPADAAGAIGDYAWVTVREHSSAARLGHGWNPVQMRLC